MSIADVQDMLFAHNERERRRAEELIEQRRWEVKLVHWQSTLTSYAFWKPSRMPSCESSFPELFKDKADAEDAPLWKRQQAGFASWVKAYNDTHRKEG